MAEIIEKEIQAKDETTIALIKLEAAGVLDEIEVVSKHDLNILQTEVQKTKEEADRSLNK